MPVTSSMTRKRESVSDYSSIIGMGPINTTSFLFGDDDEKSAVQKESATSPDVKSYLQMNTTDDKFPILIRNNHQPGLVSILQIYMTVCGTNGFMQLSASSAALDLALSQSPGPESQSNGWLPFARHRPSQQSLPQNIFEIQHSNQQNIESPTAGSQQFIDPATDSPSNIRQLNRRSMEASLGSVGPKSVLNPSLTNGGPSTRPTMANLQSSYSTNDIPTLKNPNGLASIISPQKSTAQQQFHNHNASLGRIPPHAAINRVGRETHRDIPSGDARREEPSSGYKQLQSELHASAAPFGPSVPASTPSESMLGSMPTNALPQYTNPAYYGGYGMQMMGMTPMQTGGPLGFPTQMPLYPTQNQYSPYPQYGQHGRFPDSQARVIQQRRLQNVEGILQLPTSADSEALTVSRCCSFHQYQNRELPRRYLCSL